MKRFIILVVLLLGLPAMAIEEAPFALVERDGPFEIRDYAPHVLAVVEIEGDMEPAGNQAFRRLFGYISGRNLSRVEIAMTAPVGQSPASREIEMTAPVGQQRADRKWAVSFMMPTSFTLESLPVPEDPGISLVQVEARRVAAIRYSGRWTKSGFERNRRKLEAWMARRGLLASAEPIWARYNPPITPWFLRRNEVLIPLSSSSLK